MQWTKDELFMVEALAKNWAVDLNEVNPVMMSVLRKMHQTPYVAEEGSMPKQEYPVAMPVEEYLEVEGAFVQVLRDSGLMNEGNVQPILGAVRHALTKRGVVVPNA